MWYKIRPGSMKLFPLHGRSGRQKQLDRRTTMQHVGGRTADACVMTVALLIMSSGANKIMRGLTNFGYGLKEE